MLEFINNNGVFFSGIFSIITAIIAATVAIIIDNRKSKYDTIRALKEDNRDLRLENKRIKEKLENAKKEIKQFVNKENSEIDIIKNHGSIYTEKLPNGNTREICGYCWEREHIKIPINVNIMYDEYTKQYYYDGYCYNCKIHCTENINPEPEKSSNEFEEIILDDEDLPF